MGASAFVEQPPNRRSSFDAFRRAQDQAVTLDQPSFPRTFTV